MSILDTHGVSAPAEGASLERMVADTQGRAGAVLTVLERLQQANPHNYLPATSVRQAAQMLGIPPSQAWSVVTFYSFFNLKPQGAHSLAICRGTACHTRGSRNLLEAVVASLRFPAEEGGASDRPCMTTTDNQFTVRTVACFGQCALAPVVEVDRTILGHVNRQKLLSRVEQMAAKGGRS